MYCICAFYWYIPHIIIILTLIRRAQTRYDKLMVNLLIGDEIEELCPKIIHGINSRLFYLRYLWYRGIFVAWMPSCLLLKICCPISDLLAHSDPHAASCDYVLPVSPPSVESGSGPLFAYGLREIDIRAPRKYLKCLALNGALLKLSRHCHVFENITRTWKA
jgi:hypothetical protein